jgi:hypothetical protein
MRQHSLDLSPQNLRQNLAGGKDFFCHINYMAANAAKKSYSPILIYCAAI